MANLQNARVLMLATDGFEESELFEPRQALLDAGAQVTLVHRNAELKSTIKYWVRPDIENRIKEGSIQARFESLEQNGEVRGHNAATDDDDVGILDVFG